MQMTSKQGKQGKQGKIVSTQTRNDQLFIYYVVIFKVWLQLVLSDFQHLKSYK